MPTEATLPTFAATPGVPTTAAATPTDDGIPDPPPEGALGYSDFAEQGERGSYCYDGGCADVGEWPPPADELPTVESQGESLILSVDKDQFDAWTVEYSGAGSAPSVLAHGGEHFDPDMVGPSPGAAVTFIEFDSPPSGDWVVTAFVHFAGGGSASYAWHLIVE